MQFTRGFINLHPLFKLNGEENLGAPFLIPAALEIECALQFFCFTKEEGICCFASI